MSRLHRLHADGCERLHRLQEIAESLGARLISMRESLEADKLTALYHQTIDDIRRQETLATAIEAELRLL
jgi:hypothetical protein